MPELPDVVAYLTALELRVLGRRLERLRLASPFVLRSVDPPVSEVEGRMVVGLRRLGKRIVLALEGERYVVIHLMIAGRLHWRPAGARPPGRIGLAAFDFPDGTLIFTEAGTRRRAAIHLARGEAALAAHDPGGLDVLGASARGLPDRPSARAHTLKRTLTDPRLLDGIGNAYSDEILHRARLSPVRMSRPAGRRRARTAPRGDPRGARRVDGAALARRRASRSRRRSPPSARGWRCTDGTAKPCPGCGAPVQRIVHAENESNYCAACQTGGRLLADRALSRLLRRTGRARSRSWRSGCPGAPRENGFPLDAERLGSGLDREVLASGDSSERRVGYRP